MKKILYFILLMLFLFSQSSFAFGKKNQPVLFLSPYDPRVESDNDTQIEHYDVFKVNSRIYFYVYTPKGFQSDYIKYQIVKQEDNAHMGGYTRIRNITKRVRDKNSFCDYFVLSQSGKYLIQVFDITNLHQWIVYGEFRVVDE